LEKGQRWHLASCLPYNDIYFAFAREWVMLLHTHSVTLPSSFSYGRIPNGPRIPKSIRKLSVIFAALSKVKTSTPPS
jgi:hypothetical protein